MKSCGRQNGLVFMSVVELQAAVHSGAFCQFHFSWIYYYGSNKSTGKETGKTHLCAVVWHMFKCVCLSRAELAHINESLKCLCQTQAARLSSWLHQFFIDHHQHEVLHLAFYVSL